MARITTTTYRVRIPLPVHGGLGDLAALFDMLRYEGARVTDWSRDRDARDREVVIVTVASERYTLDRWLSFGIFPEVIS